MNTNAGRSSKLRLIVIDVDRGGSVRGMGVRFVQVPAGVAEQLGAVYGDGIAQQTAAELTQERVA